MAARMPSVGVCSPGVKRILGETGVSREIQPLLDERFQDLISSGRRRQEGRALAQSIWRHGETPYRTAGRRDCARCDHN